MEWIQILILVTGVITQWLVARRNKWWMLFALIGQPAWIYSTFHAEQWGMALLSIYYTLTVIYAIRIWWYPRRLKNNLEDHLRRNKKGEYLEGSEYILRVVKDNKGSLEFYVRPADSNGDTINYEVEGNDIMMAKGF